MPLLLCVNLLNQTASEAKNKDMDRLIRGESVKAEAHLRRQEVEYVPSIDNFDVGDPDAYKYRPLQNAPAEVKRKVRDDLREIARHCRRRIIRPRNDAEYERLREAEIVNSAHATPQSGALYNPMDQQSLARRAKDTGSGDVLEYGEMISAVKRCARTTSAADKEEEDLTTHPHQVVDTVLHQLQHVERRSQAVFAEDEMFTMQLVMTNPASWSAVAQMSEWESCERELGKLKDYAPRKQTKKVGEFFTHFGNECGLRLFCVYVRPSEPSLLYLAFELDPLQRYFCVMVFTSPDSAEMVEEARGWCLEALDYYKTQLSDVSRATHAFKPCKEMPKRGERMPDAWQLYNIVASKTLQNFRITFEYAYYSACQCVPLLQDAKIEET